MIGLPHGPDQAAEICAITLFAIAEVWSNFCGRAQDRFAASCSSRGSAIRQKLR